MGFPSYCQYREQIVTDAQCLQCFRSPLDRSNGDSSRRRMDCCRANLRPTKPTEPAAPRTFAHPELEYRFLIETLSARNLRGAIGNAAQIACQNPDERTARALLSALRLHWICQRQGQGVEEEVAP